MAIEQYVTAVYGKLESAIEAKRCGLRASGIVGVVSGVRYVSKYEVVGIAQFNGDADGLAIVPIDLGGASRHIFIKRVGARIVEDDFARAGKSCSRCDPDVSAPDFECPVDDPMRIGTKIARFGEAEFHGLRLDDDGGVVGCGAAGAGLGI